MTVQQPGNWRKASYSKERTDCVEVRLASKVGVRDTKDRDGGHLDLNLAAFGAFVGRLKGDASV
ncbi:DUF397 domain-containing protein [Amycolatopsis sp. CA-230715]|uniref:DUF397 domain-containing protein n=1 Tax=Amycolatopsis sp. CA-230715 TaxID=2745196 RepID=UPI001C0343DA|nr:DUF397 domain-containing protein [Amycolatopsis sp. CA-230715]QWF85906.1 hypothetical protein HUW46_09386 [Amycolatopsis sp. CA-230715]